MIVRIDDRQRDTILAALRHWQDRVMGKQPDIAGLRDIATNSGASEALKAEEIDTLCHGLNLGGPADRVVADNDDVHGVIAFYDPYGNRAELAESASVEDLAWNAAWFVTNSLGDAQASSAGSIAFAHLGKELPEEGPALEGYPIPEGTLTERLWWFIENVGDDEPNRSDLFFQLREEVRGAAAKRGKQA